MPKFNNRSYIPDDFKGLPENAELMFEGEIFDVYQWDQLAFDGKTKLRFEKLKRCDSVRVIALTDDGRILINKEEQPGTGLFYDLPAGKHDDPDETEEQAAKRELLEETGYSFKNWKMVSARQLMVKIDWINYAFLAWGEEPRTNTDLEAGEKIEVLKLSLKEITDLFRDSDNVRTPEKEKSLFLKASSVADLKALPDLRDNIN
jgi:ADP-ribose pyrophosphatase